MMFPSSAFDHPTHCASGFTRIEVGEADILSLSLLLFFPAPLKNRRYGRFLSFSLEALTILAHHVGRAIREIFYLLETSSHLADQFALEASRINGVREGL